MKKYLKLDFTLPRVSFSQVSHKRFDFDRGGVGILFRKYTAFCSLILSMIFVFSGQITAQQTLCQQFAATTSNVIIGAPINNNQQSITFLSSLYPNGANLQNQKIRINGILKVDRALTLNNCTVELEAGAQIVTDGAVTISSTSSRYYSCNTMWQGFFIKSNATILLLWGEIEDAEAALTVDDGAGISVAGVLFDRNHIGIRNGSATNGVSALNFIFFGGNTFDCTSGLNQPFHFNLSPAWSSTGYAGIYLNTVVGTIASSLTVSGFQHLRYGIYLENSDVSVSACSFQNMGGTLALPNDGNGIRSIGGTLRTAFCTFGQVTHGIWAVGSELDVHDNTFNVTSLSGVTSTGNFQTDFIFITNNTLTLQGAVGVGVSRVGINVVRNSRGNSNLASFNISNNNITMNGSNNAMFSEQGIIVNGPFPSLDIGLISNNTVNGNTTTVHLQNGIVVRAGLPDRYRVLSNTVTFTDPAAFPNSFNGARWAIAMLYGTGINHRLQNNNCQANGGNDGQGYCGLHLEDMLNVTMCNNQVNNYYHGIHFFGSCNGLGFWQNTMDHHQYASVRLQDNSSVAPATPGFIGTHTRTGNRWILPITALNNSTWVNTIGLTNLIVVPQNTTPFSPITFIPAGFGSVVAGAETGCAQPPSFGPEGGGELTEYDHWVKNGAVGMPSLSAWEVKRQLMYKLMRFPAILSTDASVNSYYNANFNTSAGKYAQVDYLFLQSAQLITETQLNNITALTDQRLNLLTQIDTLDASNASVMPASTPTLTLVDGKRALLNTWKVNFSNRNLLRQEIGIQRLTSIQQAQQLLATITPSNVHETNWKTILNIQLNNAIGGGNTEEALSQLRNIAAQCPETAGGSAVHAMYMLPAEEVAALRPAEQVGLLGNCEATPRTSEADVSQKIPVNLIQISPNPAKDLITVRLLKEASGEWKVSNIQGRVVLNGKIHKQQEYQIETDALNPGVYILSFTDLDKITSNQRFIISK